MSTTTPRLSIGCEDAVYALLTDGTDVAGGTAIYGTVYPLVGLKQFNYQSNSGLTRWYGDNAVFAASEFVGDQALSVDIADIQPQDRNRLFGFDYVNGVIVEKVDSVSPYVAFGAKITMEGGVSSYVWFGKVKFNKPSLDANTKESSVAFQSVMIEGAILPLICNSVYRVSARTDDTAVAAATLTGWFNQPVISATADASALTVAITAGAGATKTMLATFSKASNSASYPFVLPADSITAIASALQVLKVADGTTAGPITAAILSAGTGLANSTITVTITTNVSNTAVYNAIAANSAIKDGSGVSVSAYLSGSVTTRT